MPISLAMVNKAPPPSMCREITRLVDSKIIEEISKFLPTVKFTQNVNVGILYCEGIEIAW